MVRAIRYLLFISITAICTSRTFLPLKLRSISNVCNTHLDCTLYHSSFMLCTNAYLLRTAVSIIRAVQPHPFVIELIMVFKGNLLILDVREY